MDDLLIPFGTWPEWRNPALPPFLVEEYHKDTYRIVGTFPNGVVSVVAVPGDWCRLANEPFSSLYEALAAARRLNKLNAQGEIDWEPDFPRMKNSERR